MQNSTKYNFKAIYLQRTPESSFLKWQCHEMFNVRYLKIIFFPQTLIIPYAYKFEWFRSFAKTCAVNLYHRGHEALTKTGKVMCHSKVFLIFFFVFFWERTSKPSIKFFIQHLRERGNILRKTKMVFIFKGGVQQLVGWVFVSWVSSHPPFLVCSTNLYFRRLLVDTLFLWHSWAY